MRLEHLSNTDTLSRLAELRIDRRPRATPTPHAGRRLLMGLAVTAAVLIDRKSVV